jgi:hypothetical protein
MKGTTMVPARLMKVTSVSSHTSRLKPEKDAT